MVCGRGGGGGGTPLEGHGQGCFPKREPFSPKTLTVEVSARKGIHQPAEPHAGQQEEHKGPEEVLGAVAPAALAQEGKDERSEKGEERHRLNVAQHQRRALRLHRYSFFPTATS